MKSVGTKVLVLVLAIHFNSSNGVGSGNALLPKYYYWWSVIVVCALHSTNEVNLCRAWLVLRWATVSCSIPGAGHLFRYVTNQPPRLGMQRQVWFIPLADVHGVCTPLRTRGIPERLRGVITTRRYTKPRYTFIPYTDSSFQEYC